MKFRITYLDFENEDEYTLTIIDRENPDDEPIDFDAGFVRLAPQGTTSSLEPTIINTTLSFSIRINNEAQEAIIDALVNAYPRQFYVVLSLNEVVEFKGYIDTDDISHIDSDFPFDINIGATAGLGQLGEYKYRQRDGAPYTSSATLIDHIFNVFDSLYITDLYDDEEVFLGTSINTYETRHDHLTIDTFANTRINQQNWIRNNDGGLVEMEFIDQTFRVKEDPDNLRYRSCLEVIENIIHAFPARLTYERGRYCIRSIERLKELSFDEHRYQADKTYLGKFGWGNHHTLACTDSYTHTLFSATHRYLKTLKQVIYKYELGHEQNVINNKAWDYLNAPFYPAVISLQAVGNTRLDLNFAITSQTIDIFSSGMFHHRYVYKVFVTIGSYTLRRDFLGIDPITREPEFSEITWAVGANPCFVVSPIHDTTIQNQALHAYLTYQTPPIPESGNLGVQVLLDRVINAVDGTTLPADGIFTQFIPGTNVSFNYTYIWAWRSYNSFIGVLSDKADINIAANSFIRYTATVDMRSPETYERDLMIGDDSGTGHGLSKLEIFDGAVWLTSATWRLNAVGTAQPLLQIAVETIGNIRGVTRRIIEANVRTPLLFCSTRLTYRGHRYVLTSFDYNTSDRLASISGIAILFTSGKSTIKASGLINSPGFSSPGSAPNVSPPPTTPTPSTYTPTVYKHLVSGISGIHIDIPFAKQLPDPANYTLEELYVVFDGSKVNSAPLIPVLGTPTRPGSFAIDRPNHRFILPTNANPAHTYFFKWIF
jgi:hypothetical protein